MATPAHEPPGFTVGHGGPAVRHKHVSSYVSRGAHSSQLHFCDGAALGKTSDAATSSCGGGSSEWTEAASSVQTHRSAARCNMSPKDSVWDVLGFILYCQHNSGSDRHRAEPLTEEDQFMKRSSSMHPNCKLTVARCLLWVPLLSWSSLAGAASPIGSDPLWLGKLGNTLLFVGQPASSTGPGSATLYSSDGTTAGTTKVATIGGVTVYTVTYNLGTSFLSAGTKVYFLGDAMPSQGQQVWVTDGTAAGTHQVTNIEQPTNASPALLGIIGTNLIFADYASDNTLQLGTVLRPDDANRHIGVIKQIIIQPAPLCPNTC